MAHCLTGTGVLGSTSGTEKNLGGMKENGRERGKRGERGRTGGKEMRKKGREGKEEGEEIRKGRMEKKKKKKEPEKIK